MAEKKLKYSASAIDAKLDKVGTLDSQVTELAQEMGNKASKTELATKAEVNGLYDGLTAGAALRLVPHGDGVTKEVIGICGRKAGGDSTIDADINAKIACIKGYTLMWRQMIPDGGTSVLEPDGNVTIGGTYEKPRYTTNNRPYLMYNPTGAEAVVAGVTVAAGWSVQRIGTESAVELGAGWKLIDLLLTFGTELGHTLDTTDKVAKAMGYVATTAKTAFEVWQDTEQFTSDMAYSAQTVIRNGRWDGLRSVGKDGDGNAFDFTRSIEQIRRQYFPEGMNGIGIGTSSEVCDTIEAGQVVRRVGVVKLKDLSWETWNNGDYRVFFATVPGEPGGVTKQLFISLPYLFIGTIGAYSGKADKTYWWRNDGNYARVVIRDTSYNNKASFVASLTDDDYLDYELATPIITPITELNLTYPVSNTEGTETPVCEPSTNCAPLAANITYGLDAYATIVDLKKRVEALEKK